MQNETKKKIQNFKRRNFKSIIIGAGIIYGIGMASVVFDAGKLAGNISGQLDGFNKGYDANYDNGFSDATIPSNDIYVSNKNENDTTEYISDKTEVLAPVSINNEKKLTEYILEKYNSLGNAISLNDLGCATQNAPYLFIRNDGTYEYGITNNVNANERVEYDTLYVFTDNVNDHRPIAGIVKTENGYFNVDVTDYDLHEQRIIRDDNKYVTIIGNNLKEYYEEAQDYLKQRESKLATK